MTAVIYMRSWAVPYYMWKLENRECYCVKGSQITVFCDAKKKKKINKTPYFVDENWNADYFILFRVTQWNVH